MKSMGWTLPKETDTLVNDFQRLHQLRCPALPRQDITGSIAHATMLGRRHHPPHQDAQAIISSLKAIHGNPTPGAAGGVLLENEDIHMNIEAMLTQRIGRGGQAAPHRPQPQRPGGGGFPALH